MMKKILSSFAGQILIVLIGLAIISACSLGTVPKAESGLQLQNTEWVLKTLKNQLVTSSQPPTLAFEDSRVSGFAGCNRFFGSYTASTDNTVGIGPLGATKMACGNEQSSLEQSYFAQLNQVTQYAISRDQLNLLDAERNILLVFTLSKISSAK